MGPGRRGHLASGGASGMATRKPAVCCKRGDFLQTSRNAADRGGQGCFPGADAHERTQHAQAPTQGRTKTQSGLLNQDPDPCPVTPPPRRNTHSHDRIPPLRGSLVTGPAAPLAAALEALPQLLRNRLPCAHLRGEGDPPRPSGAPPKRTTITEHIKPSSCGDAKKSRKPQT